MGIHYRKTMSEEDTILPLHEIDEDEDIEEYGFMMGYYSSEDQEEFA